MEEAFNSKDYLKKQKKTNVALDCEDIIVNKEQSRYKCYNTLQDYESREKGRFEYDNVTQEPYLFLSKPYYTNDKQYAFILYVFGRSDHGSNQIMIFKRENDDWEFKINIHVGYHY